MFIILKNTLLLVLALLFSTASFSQSTVDSLVREHHLHLDDYYRDKSNMNQRTWIKLVELGQQADAVIETDKVLIERYLKHELRRNQDMSREIEKLKLEMGAIKKESEVQQMILDQQRFMNKALLFGLLAAGILFIIFLILFVDRQSRVSTLKMELEHMWSKKDEDPSQEQLIVLQQQLDKINLENKELKTSLSDNKSKEENLRKKLQKEQESHARVEKEIKSLIERLHQNV